MKLLIVTQKADKNDPILGFFHSWLREFAAHFDAVTVICLEEGEHDLPANVKVLSLGKEDGKGRFSRVSAFYKYIWRERKNYDAVFVHMNPIYVVLGGLLWKSWGKKIGLWYVHRSVDLKLRSAGLIVDDIYTASKESCRLNSRKIRIVGHGIDVEKFAGIEKRALPIGKLIQSGEEPVRIIHVGRITKIKNCDTLIKAAQILKDSESRNYEVVFVGEPVTSEDIEYKKSLEKRIRELGLSDMVKFAGAVPNSEIPEWYAKADFTVNLAPTGGVDKAVLESLASGTPAFFSNDSFLDIFAPYENMFHVAYRDAGMLAEKIRLFSIHADAAPLVSELKARVIERFSVSALISNISLNIHDASR